MFNRNGQVTWKQVSGVIDIGIKLKETLAKNEQLEKENEFLKKLLLQQPDVQTEKKQ